MFSKNAVLFSRFTFMVAVQMFIQIPGIVQADDHPYSCSEITIDTHSNQARTRNSTLTHATRWLHDACDDESFQFQSNPTISKDLKKKIEHLHAANETGVVDHIVKHLTRCRKISKLRAPVLPQEPLNYGIFQLFFQNLSQPINDTIIREVSLSEPEHALYLLRVVLSLYAIHIKHTIKNEIQHKKSLFLVTEMISVRNYLKKIMCLLQTASSISCGNAPLSTSSSISISRAHVNTFEGIANLPGNSANLEEYAHAVFLSLQGDLKTATDLLINKRCISAHF